MTDIADQLADDIHSAENPRAVPGSNNPPPDDDPLVIKAQQEAIAANAYLAAHGDIQKWTPGLAAEANREIDAVGNAWEALDGQRLQEGRDFKALQTKKYTTPLSLLEIAKGKLVVLRRAYLKRMEDILAEQQRIQQEEADKARREAEELAKKDAGDDPLGAELAAQQATERANELQQKVAEAPVKAYVGGASKATGLKDYWFATIEDLSAAFKHYNAKKHPAKPILEAAIREAIQNIANNEAKTLKDEKIAVPGVTYRKDRR